MERFQKEELKPQEELRDGRVEEQEKEGQEKELPCRVGEVLLCYVAIGRRTLSKAARSAASALATTANWKKRKEEAAGVRWKAWVATDQFERARGFDCVVAARANTSGLEFAAFRKYASAGDSLETRAADWGDREDAGTRAVTSIRRAKIAGLAQMYEKAPENSCLVFLDADTLVCKDPRLLCCQAGERASVAFVPVPRDRWHAAGVLKKFFPGLQATVPEANTGVLVLRKLTASDDDPTARLLADWGAHYETLSNADPPQLMDQVAFRAALFTSRAPFARLPSNSNCRGRDAATRAHAPLGCAGVPPDATGRLAARDGPESSARARAATSRLERSLGDGRCLVLHSHDLTSLKPPPGTPSSSSSSFTAKADGRARDEPAAAGGPPGKQDSSGGKSCLDFWIDVPFASADETGARDTLLTSVRDARTVGLGCDKPTKLAPPNFVSTSPDLDRAALVVRDPLERVMVEFEVCCLKSQDTAWCRPEVLDACPPAPFLPGAVGRALAAFADRRGNAQLDAVLAVLRPLLTSLSTGHNHSRLQALAADLPSSNADLRVLAAYLFTSPGLIVGVAERPRDLVDAANRGSLRSKRYVNTPPYRSPLRAELSNEHLRAIRRSTALDRALYDALAGLTTHGVERR